MGGRGVGDGACVMVGEMEEERDSVRLLAEEVDMAQS